MDAHIKVAHVHGSGEMHPSVGMFGRRKTVRQSLWHHFVWLFATAVHSIGQP